ncbi:MAG: flagellar motor switch protein FliM [Thermoleophilia bacterium]|nr:flagellar motor switch protein FliM [Thermoleophilia bacterium]
MSDVLSQSEIDALLSAISSGDVDAAQMREEAEEPHVRTFDFLRPSKFSKDQLRTVEMMHENFCRLVQTQLSAQLRTMVELDVISADQVSYGEFVTSMPVPALINIVSMEPLEGNAILEINLPIVFSVIDRLVGGPGTHRPKLRELTEIELALIQGVTDTLLRGLAEAWSDVIPSRFRKVGAEMNPQFAQIAAPSDMVVLVSFELRVGGSTGMMSLCVPYLVLEPAVGRLTAQSYFSGRSDSASPELRAGIAAELGAVAVPVSVELGRAELELGDLLALEPGDVIPLQAAPGSDVTVRVGRRAAFLAQPGVRGKHSAVQITACIEDTERTPA